MRFSYEAAFGKSSANGYERVLLDAMSGDATLSSHRDGVEAAWALFPPILEEWAKEPDLSFPNYPAGSWGLIKSYFLYPQVAASMIVFSIILLYK
jgi:glucose-6-phosphate 1-dehydrogenase